MNSSETFDPTTSCDIAIIGMAGRFPRAEDIEAYWQNLKDGVECISFFSNEELEVPVSAAHLSNPAYIKAKGVLEDIDLFDASFFSISAREAQWMDPQQRLFLECAWSAIEDAGYNVETYKGAISVYAGLNASTYLMSRFDQIGIESRADLFQVLLANEKDHLATRVSYKLNLRGESITVQTSCSTSLVATHLACQSLLSGQSDMALAGGVSIRVPQKTGYFYQEGMISSPDGHCRAFDHKAQGTLPGHGLGVVVLKLLSEALKDGDHIYAVIKGSAINNDGHMKMGYTAPSVEGQADAVSKAMAIAGVEADTIGLIEAHGTGTPIGDPIEVEALTRVFRQQTNRKNFCALGSVKTNLGHLDNAAGIAGLIKAVLALRHRQIPSTLHFERPNPSIDLDNSPFYVNNALVEWNAGSTPRRAGVSSFGIGGTNAHIILEEAPAPPPASAQRPCHLFTLSARTMNSLDKAVESLAAYAGRTPDIEIANAAYTYNVGRKEFPHRRFVVARDQADLLEGLRAAAKSTAEARPNQKPRTVFMFPGQGAQHIEMAKELYESEPGFRRSLDLCADILKESFATDLRELIFPSDDAEAASRRLSQPCYSLPALFSVQYSLAQLWMSWGVKPDALIGHSFGEFTAACLAGVFSLKDALSLVVERGRLMQTLAPGAMLGVRLSEQEIRRFLNDDLAIAAINSHTACVVSGPIPAIERLEQALASNQISFRRLGVPFAYHSVMVEPILDQFTEVLKKITRKPPTIPFISNLSGTWIEEETAISAEYWARQMRATVLFAAGLETLVESRHQVFLEVGPNQTLYMIAKQHLGRSKELVVTPSLPNARSDSSDFHTMMTSLGNLWSHGVEINWAGFYAEQRRYRLSLPTYGFDRQRYWIERRDESVAASQRPEPTQDPVAFKTIVASKPEKHSIQRETLMQDYEAPRNEIEEALAGIWADILGLREIGIYDNFFEIGGDSLLATRVFSRIKQSFSVDLSLQRMMSCQTIAELSHEVQIQFQSGADSPDVHEGDQDEYYCAFELALGDSDVTIHLTQQDYLEQGLPEGAKNFRLLVALPKARAS